MLKKSDIDVDWEVSSRTPNHALFQATLSLKCEEAVHLKEMDARVKVENEMRDRLRTRLFRSVYGELEIELLKVRHECKKAVDGSGSPWDARNKVGEAFAKVFKMLSGNEVE